MQDLKGSHIKVGDRVKVLSIDTSVFSNLSENEVSDLKSMIGETFEIYEIDSYGIAWVEKWWGIGSENLYSHSLGLSSTEIELVEWNP